MTRPSAVQLKNLATVLSDLGEVRKILAIELSHGGANLPDALAHMQQAAAGAGLSALLAPKEITKLIVLFKEFSLAMAPGSAPTPSQLQSWTLRIAKVETAVAAVLKDPPR